MTRFARAKGSKGGGPREPEQATPWAQMKAQLQQSQKNDGESTARAEFESKRNENYEHFLKEEEEKNPVKKVWCDFEGDSKAQNDSQGDLGKNAKKKMKRKLLEGNKKEEEALPKKKKRSAENVSIEEMDADDEELNKWLDEYTDKEIDEKYEDLTSKLESKLKKSEKKIKTQLQTDEKKVKPSKKKKKQEAEVNNDEEWNVTSVEESVPEPKKKKKEKKQIEAVEAAPKKSKHKNVVNIFNEEPFAKQSDDAGDKIDLASFVEKKEAVEDVVKVDRPKKKRNKKAKAKQAEKGSDELKTDAELPSKPLPDQPKSKPKKKRRKPVNEDKQTMIVDGEELEIKNFGGFPVLSSDADRLFDLRKSLISKGIPRGDVERTMKFERRKAEKALSRIKKKLCFHCRKGGHTLAECPNLKGEGAGMPASGICFKCGSTEHTHFACRVVKSDDYKFAKCFICNEQGHISRQCPDNPRGLYPKGGACKECGDVTHLKKDCPMLRQEKEESTIKLDTIRTDNIEDISIKSATTTNKSAKVKHVKF